MSEQKVLTSPQNPLLKEIRRAVEHGELTSDGFAVAEGTHLLEEAFRSRCEVPVVLVSETAQSRLTLAPPAGHDLRVVVVADSLFRKISDFETTQGVMALVRPPVWNLTDVLFGIPLVMVLDGVQHPGNAGAILRVAEAFNASGVVFLKGSVNPHNPKCVRSSAGSIFRLPIVTGVETDQLFAAFGDHRIAPYSAMPGGSALLHDSDLAQPCAILLGSEGQGVRPELARRTAGIRIPTAAVESLNVAVAAGIFLYEARRQRALSRPGFSPPVS